MLKKVSDSRKIYNKAQNWHARKSLILQLYQNPMPELPEVQTIVSELKREGLIGRTIQDVYVYWPRTVATPDVNSFMQLLSQQTITGISRRGKYLIFHLSHHYDLLVHLKMTGRLLLVPKNAPSSPYIRLVLDLDQEQQLRFHDTRKFGRWYLVSQAHAFLHKMGPEPLAPDFSLEQFALRIKQRHRALKPLLLDQTFLAGLGNIYVDEALWEAKLHPLQPAHTLKQEEIKALYHAILHVLKKGLENQGTTLGKGLTNFYRLNGKQGEHQTLLKVFRRTGEHCERCHTTIERIIVAQRGTHLCPHCQKLRGSKKASQS